MLKTLTKPKPEDAVHTLVLRYL